MKTIKAVIWVGSSHQDLQDFPKDAKAIAGHQLWNVQRGLEPSDWKPMENIGPGTKEIRVQDPSGIFRVFYVARFEEGVYVLHCLQKKTQKTPLRDLRIAKIRYQAVLLERKGHTP